MKKFNAPEVEIEKFEIADVLTESSEDPTQAPLPTFPDIIGPGQVGGGTT